MSFDKRVDAYIAKSPDFAKPILEHLRELVHKACPEVVEAIKWGFPNFEHHGLMCNMASFTQHCAFGFWKASLLEDPIRGLSVGEKSSMGHLGKLKALADLPADKVLLRSIKQAMKLNEDGIQMVRKPRTTAKKVTVPAYFKKALATNKAANNIFPTFSSSKQKDYLDWIIEAKTEETRLKRMTTALEWIAEGKGRNWKYETKMNVKRK